MKKELVFTAFNRPEYLRQTIDSWNNVRTLSQWNATFFIEPSEKEDEIAEIAMGLNTTVTTYYNPDRLGVLINPWNALNNAFLNGADFVVLAEDDIIVSQDILEYFEFTSLEYETSYDVLAINAFSDMGGGKPGDMIETRAFSPLIWGTWHNRWEQHLRDSWDKDYSTGLPDGSQAGWDWNINRILQNEQMRIIKPLQSRSSHIGLFGTHMTPDLMPASQGVDFLETRGRARYSEI